MITITRIYSDDKGDSHFGEIKIPLSEAGETGALSERYPVEEIIFRTVNPAYDYEFHCAPERQFIILLDGEIEIETSVGEKRKFKGGEILLVEDTEGKGHKTRNTRPIVRKSVFVTLAKNR